MITKDSQKAGIGGFRPDQSQQLTKWSISDITTIDSPRSLFQNVYEFIHGVVRQSRLLDVEPATLISMKQDVVARVDALCPGPYDPVTNHEDQLYEERITETKKKKSEYEIAEPNYVQLVKDAKDQAALLKPDNRAPEPSTVVTIAAIAILAVGFTFTTYDYFFFQIKDVVLRGTFSFLSAIAIATFVVWIILVDAPKASLRSFRTWLALIGGIVVSLMTAILRAVHAQTTAQAIFALCLGGLEIGVLCALEAHASNLRHQASQYANAQVQSQVLSDVESGLERCRSEIKRFDSDLAEHGRHVALRATWHNQIKAIRQAAEQAVEAAFRAAILQNRAEYLP